MCPAQNRIKTKGIAFLLITALFTTGLFSCQNVAFADTVILSEETYYHLDMGVQIAYNSGCSWGAEHIYGDAEPIAVNTTITFNSDIKAVDVYPLSSAKGGSYDFNGETSSHNIPAGLGEAAWAYNEFFTDRASLSMTEGSCSSSGKNISFTYTAKLKSTRALEVVEYGILGNDQEIYQLFGGKAALEADQPEIAEAIETALKAGREGTAGTNKLYLVFCPNVIAYKKYITVGDLEAKLDLPKTVKQGEIYAASDASSIDGGLTVEQAVLQKHYGDGDWETVAEWNGPGLPGSNTKGSANESCDEICTVTYRLTVTTTNGQTDTDTKTIQITDSREVDGEAILELPAFTYEGHPTPARDCSVFTVDGVNYSARRAYEEGVADSAFVPLPASAASVARESLTSAVVVFPKRGNYRVELDIDTVSGTHLSDIEPITVRKTPYILDDLGGFQKQNRKQILNISVATYPGKPIVDYSIELTDLKTGQSIDLTPSQPQQNNAIIKTRAITSSGDTYWTNFEMQFLTKAPAFDPDDPDYTQNFRYTIYMKDSKGDTDSVQKTFTVVPDLPPNVQITIQDSFIRNKGTNTAEIQVEDSSTTDGDQLQRIWTVKGVDVRSLPGFKDNSFGSGQKIQYNKNGVGQETVDLSVKDIWTEPTLEEYISESDRLSASTTAATQVINIAPTVRLEPIETETADIAIVTKIASESGIKAGINSLKAALIEAGIDANVQVIPTAKPNSDGYRNVGYHDWKAAINDQTQQSTGMVFDSEYAYVIEAAGFQMSGYQEVAIPPYTVKALKKSETGTGPLTVAWSYTAAESTSFRLLTDSSESYIYLACSDTGKTILLNRDNGAYVTTLPVVIPDSPYTTPNNNNLYFLTGANIQKYDPDTGTLRTVINKGGTLGRMQNGKMAFVGSESSHKFYIGQFDMKTETITQKSLPELQEYVTSESKSAVTPTDLDTTGKVTFTQVLTNDNYDKDGVILWLADTEQQQVYNLGRVASPNDMRTNSVGFVKDETGKAVFMYHAIHDDNSTSSSTRKYFHLYVYTLGDGDTPPAARTIYSQNNKRNNGNGISYAKYHSQENAMYLMQGAAWQGYDWGGNVWGVNARVQLPDWTVNLDQYAWGWDVADEYGNWNDYLMMTYYNYDNWVDNDRRIKMFTNSITKEQAEESALTRLADFTQNATRYIEKNFTGMEELVGKLKGAVKEKTSLKFFATDGNAIGLSRSFDLKPGQTYYYEYEIKKPAQDGEVPGSVSASAPKITFDTQNVYEGEGNLGSYYVTDMIEENFNGTLDPFFTLDSGRITDSLQTPTTSKYGSSSDLSAASQISFTIPEGKTAVAVMDVEVYHDSLAAAGWKTGVYINGQRYDSQPMSGDTNRKGYIHPYPLKPGINTITAYVCDRTRQIDSWYTKIDNLKIIFLDKNPPAAGGDFTSARTAYGWTKVTGSFQTPLKISEFQSQEMTHYPDWPPGLATSVDGNYTYYDFAIPPGKAAKIHATFQGYTSRKNTSAGTFIFPGWSVSHRGTRYEHNGVLTYVNSSDTWYSGAFQGSNRFSTQAGYQRSASFSKLETYIYPENLKDKNSFFFEEDKVYSMSKTFAGKTNIRIELDSDGENTGLLMQNLKIYYLNNGSKVYLYSKPLQDISELDGWTVTDNAAADMYTEAKPENEEDVPMVYKKGQLVSYGIFYDDYENDPSKRQYWRYTHTPYNDGPHPQAAFVLDEDGSVLSSSGAVLAQSIPRFYIDGKYTVEHWQEDSTNRTGDISGAVDYSRYDKLSNTESVTFYVEGGATAPWITSIKTVPPAVKEGNEYKLQIGVDDAEKDVLRLTTEVYKDKKLVYTHKQADITAAGNGTYPHITTGYPPAAAPGVYDVVCTVRDWSGAGIGSLRFTVVSEGKVTGFVNHTDQWDQNRKKYNLKRFGEEGNRVMQIGDYAAMPAPRLRGVNVFWSGEKFMLRAEAAGDPTSVSVQLMSAGPGGPADAGYSAVLTDTGRRTSDGAEIWEGSLWNASMINRWGRKTPQELTFRFTASYPGNVTKTHTVPVIMDSERDYWQLHRLW
jgi:hypothetical protein